jgi:hypothetical protein
MNNQVMRAVFGVCGVLALVLTQVACQPQTPAPTAIATVVPPTPTAQPARAPFAVIVPDRLRNSDPFTVVGADWPADAEIMLELRQITSSDVESISLGRVRADTQGRFKYKGIVSPVVTPGDWTLVVHGSDPVQIVSISLTIAGGGATASTTAIATAIATIDQATEIATSTALATVTSTATATATPSATPSRTPVIVSATPIVITDWRGMYFNNIILSGAPVVTRNDVDINFDWAYGSPDSRINPDSFSARWTRYLFFNQGTYRFTVRMDDGARVWLDGVLIVNAWKAGGLRLVATDVMLNKGYHDIRVEFFERTGIAVMRFTVERVVILTATPSSTTVVSRTPTASVTLTASPTVTPLPTPTLTPVPLPTMNTPTPTATPHP